MGRDAQDKAIASWYRSTGGAAGPDPDLPRRSTSFRSPCYYFPVLLCCSSSYAFLSARTSRGFQGVKSQNKQKKLHPCFLQKTVTEVR